MAAAVASPARPQSARPEHDRERIEAPKLTAPPRPKSAFRVPFDSVTGPRFGDGTIDGLFFWSPRAHWERRQVREHHKTADVSYKEAMDRIALGDYRGALELLDVAIRSVPDDAKYMYQCGNCYYHLGDFHEALENYSRAVELYVPPWRPPVPPALLPLATYFRGRAQCQVALKRFEAAYEDLSLCIALEPAFAGLYLARGDVLERMERFPEALDDYTVAIHASERAKESVSISEAYRARGLCYMTLRQMESSISDLTMAAKLRSGDAPVHVTLGQSLLLAGRLNEAFEVLQKAVELDRSHPDVANNLGLAYLGLGKIDREVGRRVRQAIIRPDLLPVPEDKTKEKEKDEAGESSEGGGGGRKKKALKAPPPQVDEITLAFMKKLQGKKTSRESLEEVASSCDSESQIRFRAAFRSFDDAEKLAQTYHGPNASALHSDILFNRGNMRSTTGDRAGALEDFGLAADLGLDPAYHHSAGLIHRLMGNNREAINSFNRALAIDPTYAPALYYGAMTLRATKRPEEAAAMLLDCLAKAPMVAENARPQAKSWNKSHSAGCFITRQDVLEQNGLLLQDLGRHEEALVMFDNALARDPRHAASLYRKGASLVQLRRPAAAEAAFKAALALGYGCAKDDPDYPGNITACAELPEYPSFWYWYAILRRQQGRHEDAIHFLSKCVRADPEGKRDDAGSRHYLTRSLSFHQLLKYELAVLDLTAALQLEPTNGLCMYRRGLAYGLLTKYNEAAEDLNAAIGLVAPLDNWMNGGRWIENLATIVASQQAEAEKARRRALAAREPSFTNASSGALGSSNRGHAPPGRSGGLTVRPPDSAHSAHSASPSASPSDPPASSASGKGASQQLTFPDWCSDAWYRLGIACVCSGQPEAAVRAFEEALTLEPTRPHYQHELAKSLQSAGRHPEAIAAFTRVLAVQPGNSHALYRRGFTYRSLGRYDDAAADFEAAKRADPKNAALWLNYLDLGGDELLEICRPGQEQEDGAAASANQM